MKITDADIAKERVQISCPVVGCKFKTAYLASSLAEKQSSEHWRARHKVKFEQEELDRLEELEDQRMKLKRQRQEQEWKDEQKLENQKLWKMQEQEMLRQVRLGKGKLEMDAEGLTKLVPLSEDERKEFEQPSTGEMESDQINVLLGTFKEEIAKVAVANDEKIAKTLDVLSEQGKNLNSLLEARISNIGGNSSGRSVIVKEPPLPKLGPGQKYED